MKRDKRRRLAGWGLMWLALLSCSAPRAAPRALLMGGSSYRDPALMPPLPGIERDLQLMADTAIGRLGFAPDAVRQLRGPALTRAAVRAAFRWLAGAGAGEPVLIYFSGHGYQLPDTDGDERDRFDEILPLFGYAEGGDEYVLDDELRDWVRALPSRRKTVIVDACCSGSGSRGAGSGAGSGARWVRKSPGCPGAAAGAAAIDGPFSDADGEDHVYLGAAQDGQAAVSSAAGSAFTGALVAALAALGSGASPRELAAFSATHLRRSLPRVFAHQPSLRGPAPLVAAAGHLRAGPGAGARGALVLDSPQRGARLAPGAPIAVQLSLPAPAAVQLWAVDRAGAVALLWPPPGTPAQVPAGALSLPGDGSWRAAPPLGRTTLVALSGAAPLRGAERGRWERALSRDEWAPAPAGWQRAALSFEVCSGAACR